jgi:hypothetical protein
MIEAGARSEPVTMLHCAASHAPATPGLAAAPAFAARSCLRFSIFPPLIRRASPRHLPHAHGMEDPTDDDLPTYDEVLADAIGYMAFTVLDELADDPEARQAFLAGFLRLVEATGVGVPAELGAYPASWAD